MPPSLECSSLDFRLARVEFDPGLGHFLGSHIQDQLQLHIFVSEAGPKLMVLGGLLRCRPKSHDQNLASTVLYVPNLLDSGPAFLEMNSLNADVNAPNRLLR